MVDLATHEAQRDGERVTLTAQEVAILRSFVERGLDVTLSRLELYQRAWGYKREPQGRALDYAMRRLRAKLGSTHTGTILGTVRGVGYQLCWAPVTPVERSPSRIETPRLPVLPRLLAERTALIEAIQSAVNAPAALVTLLGPGGIGKSTAALVAAQTLTHMHSFWIDLEGATPGGACRAVARQVFGEARDTSSLAERLGRVAETSERPVLLLLDGCERHIEELVAFAEELASESSVRLLLTSRQRLVLRREQLLPVPPLPDSEARRLLVDMAAARGAQDPTSLSGFDALVRELDGIPLALELAAARLRTRDPASLAAALAQGRKLRSRDRDQVDRHASLHTVVQDTLERLPAEDRAGLHRLTAFQGRFELDAATAVLGLDEFDAEDQIERLLDASMLHRESFEGVACYRILRPTRSVLVQELGVTTAGEEALWAHFDDLGRADPVRRIGAMDPTLRIRASLYAEDLTRCVDAYPVGQLPPAIGLLTFKVIAQVGPWDSLEALCDRVLLEPASTPPMIVTQAFVFSRRRLAEQLAGLVQESVPAEYARLLELTCLPVVGGPETAVGALELAERAVAAGDDYVAARALIHAGSALFPAQEFDRSLVLYERALRHASGHRDNTISAFNRLAQLAFFQDDWLSAREHLSSALSLTTERHIYRGVLLSNLGMVYRFQGDYERAADVLLEGLTLARMTGNQSQVGLTLLTLSELARFQGDRVAAYSYAEQVVAKVASASRPDPQHRTAWASLSLLLCEDERFEEANAVHHRWVALGYTELEPILRPIKAWILAGCGRLDEARLFLEDIEPVESIRRGFLLRLIAHARLALGDLDEARDRIDELAALDGYRPPYELDWVEELRAALEAASQ